MLDFLDVELFTVGRDQRFALRRVALYLISVVGQPLAPWTWSPDLHILFSRLFERLPGLSCNHTLPRCVCQAWLCKQSHMHEHDHEGH